MSITLDQFRALLGAEKQKSTYEALEETHGVNRYYLWTILNDPDYEPPARICRQLGIAETITIIVSRDTKGRLEGLAYT